MKVCVPGDGPPVVAPETHDEMNVDDMSNTITVPGERHGRDTVPPHISDSSAAARSG